MSVAEHEEKIHLLEVVVTPGHDDRAESAEFRKSKKRLEEDGHMECWICGSKEKLQVHHFLAEWSLAKLVSRKKLKALCELFDIYGYGKLMKDIALKSVDDIRQMMVLCQECHTGVDQEDGSSGIGIHDLPFPAWIIQKVCKDGCSPIPRRGETAEQAEARIAKNLQEGDGEDECD